MKILFATFLLIFSISSSAEIEKNAVLCETQMCFYWWPKLPLVDGWHHENEQSFSLSINAQAPNGYTFSNAETVIYAKAIFKPKEPEITTLAQLIKEDIEKFTSSGPKVTIVEVESLTSKSGKKFNSYRFTPISSGNYEQVAYSEEGEYYLIFTISSRSQAGFNSSFRAFTLFVNGYK
jgi:hypothetical protein